MERKKKMIRMDEDTLRYASARALTYTHEIKMKGGRRRFERRGRLKDEARIHRDKKTKSFKSNQMTTMINVLIKIKLISL